MTDWIEHTGGPQPVDDDVWVELDDEFEGPYADLERYKYRILNWLQLGGSVPVSGS